MSQHLDLRRMVNTACRECSRGEREETDTDGLSTNIVSVLDELPLRCVGEWAYDKIYRLVQYFGIFAGGMKNQWAALNYVEIGSGPGRCVIREDCTELDGTALAIIRSARFRSIQKAIFVDASPRVTKILNERIATLGAAPVAKAVVGDYENGPELCKTLEDLAPRSLNFVFIDPTECDVPFATIKQIVEHLGNADLLINVALGTDVNRNIGAAILSPTHVRAREKYERFLGESGFCARPDVIELATRSDYDGLRREFAVAYQEQLRKIGYFHTDIRPVRHYYYLLFASRNPKGLEFWLKSCEIAPDNQREFL
jgi:three-Cys-motif partner protein